MAARILVEITANLKKEIPTTIARASAIINAHITAKRNAGLYVPLSANASDQEKLDWFVDSILEEPLRNWKQLQIQEASVTAATAKEAELNSAGR